SWRAPALADAETTAPRTPDSDRSRAARLAGLGRARARPTKLRPDQASQRGVARTPPQVASLQRRPKERRAPPERPGTAPRRWAPAEAADPGPRNEVESLASRLTPQKASRRPYRAAMTCGVRCTLVGEPFPRRREQQELRSSRVEAPWEYQVVLAADPQT